MKKKNRLNKCIKNKKINFSATKIGYELSKIFSDYAPDTVFIVSHVIIRDQRIIKTLKLY